MSEYFFGWYFKCEAKEGTVALIPARHRRGREKSASLQIITDDGTWNVPFAYDAFVRTRGDFGVTLGQNRFDRQGISLQVQTPALSLCGEVTFGPLTPLRGDVMGPFRFVPFMQCRHSVVSMRHTVTGEITVNGRTFHFEGGPGYIEGDRGRSFPREYLWTQCFFEGGSLMLSVADIPFGAFRFTGVIGAVMLGGKEYRIATYRGAKAVRVAGGEATVRQKNMTLTAHLLEKHAHPLMAPVGGAMIRTIRESAACRAAYLLRQNDAVLLDMTAENASFEYEYPR